MKIDKEYIDALKSMCLDLTKEHEIMINNDVDMYIKLDIDIDDVGAFLKGIISYQLVSTNPEFTLTHCEDCKFVYNFLMLEMVTFFGKTIFEKIKLAM